MSTLRPRTPRLRTPRPLLALRRHPRAWWALVAAVALLAGVTAAGAVARAEAARSAWGTARPVLVATEPLRPGDDPAAAVTPGERPAAAVPPGALARLPDGAVVRQPVWPGEVLLAHHLAPPGAVGLATQVDDGRRAVAVPVDPGTTPPLEAGQLVDLLAVTAGPDGAARATVVTRGALVLAVDDDAVTVAVPEAAVPRVAAALAGGAVTVALRGPDDVGAEGTPGP